MSIGTVWARAATWVSHEVKTVKNVVQKIAGEMPAVQAEINKVAPTAERISELLLPGSSTWEQHILDVWGEAAAAVAALDDAALANGVNVALDAKLVAIIKSFLPTVKSKMVASPTSTPAS